MTRPGPHAELDALVAEGKALGAFLRPLTPEDWTKPTRCPPMDVRMLVVHLLEQFHGVIEACAQPFIDAEPQSDRVEWWRYDIAEDQRETLQWVTGAAAKWPAEAIPAAWDSALEGAAAAVAGRLERGDPAVQPGAKVIRLTDYIATRVLEATIHRMDVLDAFGRDPDPTPGGMAVTHDILATLLGADPRALGFDDADFAVAATGRRRLAEDERGRLGPLADLFPLLA